MNLDRIEQQEFQTSTFPHDAVQFTQPHATTPTVAFKNAWVLSSGVFHASTVVASTAHLGVVYAASLSVPLISTTQLVAKSVGDITIGGNQVLTWVKVADPDTGMFDSKTSGWTADSFSGGMMVDFSAVVPAGTKAVRVYMVCVMNTVGAPWYYRKGSDAAISNTPNASSEFSHRLGLENANQFSDDVYELWLSSVYTVDISVGHVDHDVYVAYPAEYLI